MNCKYISALVAVCGVAIAGTEARAGDFPRVVSHSEQSVKSALSGRNVPLLTRTPREDSSRASQAVLTSVCLQPCTASVSSNQDTLRASTSAWVLEISNGGSVGRFRNLNVVANAHAQGKPIASAMSDSSLESRGRAVIASTLASVVLLGEGEQLVALNSGRRVEGGQSAQGGPVHSAVVANRIVFGRTIDGIPVVGGGSTVSVTFDNSGNVEDFEYDWPVYSRTGQSRSTVSSAEVLARLQKFVAVATGETVAGPPISATTAAPYPVELTAASKLIKLECGFYDPGLRGGGAQSGLIQAGCYYHVLNSKLADGSPVSAGFAGAVPAADLVQADPGWREALFELKVPASSAPAPGSAGSQPGAK